MNVPPHRLYVAVPVLGAVQAYHTSLSMPVVAKKLHRPSDWPSAPVVAAVLSKPKTPLPEIAVGVLQSSGLAATVTFSVNEPEPTFPPKPPICNM